MTTNDYRPPAAKIFAIVMTIVVGVFASIALALLWMLRGFHVPQIGHMLGPTFWVGLAILVFPGPRKYLVTWWKIQRIRFMERSWAASRWNSFPSWWAVLLGWSAIALLAAGIVAPGIAVDVAPIASNPWFWVAIICIGFVQLGKLELRVFSAIKNAFTQQTSSSSTPTQLTPAESRLLVDDVRRSGEFHVSLGTTTGMLQALRNDEYGLPGGIPLYLNLATASQGILFIGLPGAGKTRGGILPALETALRSDPNAGALVISVKSTLTDQVKAIAQRAGRDPRTVRVVGPGHERMNLLTAMTPQSLGEGFRDAIGDRGAGGDRFWTDAPASLVGSYAQLLYGIGDAEITVPKKDALPAYKLKLDYSPQGLYNAIWAPTESMKDMLSLVASRTETIEAEIARLKASREEINHDIEALTAGPETEEVAQEITALQAKTASLATEINKLEKRIDALRSANRFFTGPYQRIIGGPGVASKTATSILTVLEPYVSTLVTDRPIQEAFSTSSDVSMELLNNGGILIVEIAQDDFPQAARLVHNIVFRQLRKLAADRLRDPSASPLVFCVDEYASMAAPEHISAFEKMRESKVVTLAAIQGSSNAAYKVGDNAASGIIGCFGTTVTYRTNDEKWRKSLTEHLKESEISVVSVQQNSPFSGGFHPHSIASAVANKALGGGRSYSTRREPILNTNVWSSLGVFLNGGDAASNFDNDDQIHGGNVMATAIVVTEVNGHERRDVCNFPVFTKEIIGA